MGGVQEEALEAQLAALQQACSTTSPPPPTCSEMIASLEKQVFFYHQVCFLVILCIPIRTRTNTLVFTRARAYTSARAHTHTHTHTKYMCMQVMETNATTVKQWIQVTLMQQRLVAAGEKVRTGNDAVATAVQMAQSAYAPLQRSQRLPSRSRCRVFVCVCVCLESVCTPLALKIWLKSKHARTRVCCLRADRHSQSAHRMPSPFGMRSKERALIRRPCSPQVFHFGVCFFRKCKV